MPLSDLESALEEIYFKNYNTHVNTTGSDTCNEFDQIPWQSDFENSASVMCFYSNACKPLIADEERKDPEGIADYKSSVSFDCDKKCGPISHLFSHPVTYCDSHYEITDEARRTSTPMKSHAMMNHHSLVSVIQTGDLAQLAFTNRLVKEMFDNYVSQTELLRTLSTSLACSEGNKEIGFENSLAENTLTEVSYCSADYSAFKGELERTFALMDKSNCIDSNPLLEISHPELSTISDYKPEVSIPPSTSQTRRLIFTLARTSVAENTPKEAKKPGEDTVTLLQTSPSKNSNIPLPRSMKRKGMCGEYLAASKRCKMSEYSENKMKSSVKTNQLRKRVSHRVLATHLNRNKRPKRSSKCSLTTLKSEHKFTTQENVTTPASSTEGLPHLVVGTQIAPRPMSLNSHLLATKEPFTFAKFAKSAPYKPSQNKRVFTPKIQEKSKQVALRKMGNSSLKKISPIKLTSSPEDQQYVKRSLQRIRNGQREVHKNLWRADKRTLASDQLFQKVELDNDTARPKVPKRATYKKGRNIQAKERGLVTDAGRDNKDVTSVPNSEPPSSSLPSRSDILPPDGDSLRSEVERNIGSLEGSSKCQSCVEIQLRLSKAYAQKGAIVVALEKKQNDLAISQKRIKELEIDLQEARRSNIEAMSTIKDLETEMCQLQKDKALCSHELNVVRKQLTRALEQSDVSDSSHVSSIYVSGSQKTLDDGLGEEVSPDDEDYELDNARYWRQMKAERDSAREETERVRRKQQELESTIRHYEDEIAELQAQIQDLRDGNKFQFECRDMSTQTIRRDGTFTRQQQSDKTKIPKRLLGHHSSLPVINDPPNSCKLQSTTSSLSRLETLQKSLKIKETEIATLRNEMSELEKELEKQKQQELLLHSPEMADLRAEIERLHKELRITRENYMKEMVLRKKYFNMVEDLKGKIRVFCRIKPREENHRNSSVLESPDEYTVILKTQRAKYEFTFDSVYTTEHTQDDIFNDVQNLVQSALDGYNVCIFAYGQTGSGKTYTLVGNESEPGIGPRTFRRIFQLVRDNQADVDFRISVSVFELYNERLIDLLKMVNEDKLKIRRDRYGLVYVEGAETRQVQNETQLLKLFQEACSNRHTASTRMNSESSRSHLIVTVLIESTNKITGTLLKGKLSIVDLAGSERAGKTAVVADQLREANSINKSLSALGDVIAALSSEQPHVPYRNNKLTLLMQDSLGSNAKTLMFVTISSSEQNTEESLNSLTYASRVKQITNSATRIAESKEIARLRAEREY